MTLIINGEEIVSASVSNDLFDANSILAADTDNTPAALTIAEQRLVGRITSGNIIGLTKAQILTLLNIEDGADVTDAANVATAGATMDGDASLAGNLYFLDEDAMGSDSATKASSQQAIKRYVDTVKRSVTLAPVASDTAVAVGNGTVGILIPSEYNGWEIVDVVVGVYDKGITGALDVQIRRRRAGSDVDVLSTKVTVGDEWHASDGVINTSNDDINTGDALFVDTDAIHSGTAPNGLYVTIVIQKP